MVVNGRFCRRAQLSEKSAVRFVLETSVDKLGIKVIDVIGAGRLTQKNGN